LSVVSPSSGRRPSAPSEGFTRSVALQSFDAQAALLPYALAFFGVALPIYAWACSYAANRAWMTASFAIFALNWAAFYALIDWMKRRPDSRSDLRFRTRTHILSGLLWAVAVAQISVLGLGAGGAGEPMLLLAVGAAAACVFFSAPSLPALLIVGPTAAATPLLALYINPSSEQLGRLAMAAIALVMALSLILNRLLRRLFALAAERETLVEERARSLCEAETLAKSKTDLIATLSDEIRNGLTGVAHVLAAAGAGGRAAPSRQQLNAALASAQELIAVLNATLDTERTDGEALMLERRPFDPARLARDVVLSCRPKAAVKALELTIHIDAGLAADPPAGAVFGDSTRARQILANLVGNAIKYTLRGRVEVRLERLAEDRIRLEVADTGPGLSAAEIEQAFQPFSRIARTAAGVPGAGLGLSLSRRLAGLMDGEISAESAVGVGSCFRLDLPFDATAVCEPPSATPVETLVPGAKPSALRVLVADNDPLNAALLRTTLEQLGHHVLHAHDGRRAFELAQICDVEMIVLNGGLPLMDGPETASAIRGLTGPAGGAPIIAIIEGDADEARAYFAAGVNEVLRKPVTVSSIARAVASAGGGEVRSGSRRRHA
jgi:signal transduction histidine kinase/CheY-like chemotaxis protein